MKKILFVVCTFACMALASCTKCGSGQNQYNQDTIVINDTMVIEEFDTLYIDD